MKKVKPRILPRSILDLVIVVIAMFFQILIYFVIPMSIVGYITQNILFSLAVFLIIWGYFIFGGVRYLIIDEEGIIFKRVLGSPKSIPWKNLELVEVSSPINTVLFGWFWPLIPPREMTYSSSSYGHVIFTYNEGKQVFFPPKNTEEFLEVVKAHNENLLTRGSN